MGAGPWIALAVGIVGGAAGAWWYFSQQPNPPPPDCVAPDEPPVGDTGICAEYYEPDPDSPGCCMPIPE
ncbi:MAG TPA: hypothetical protein VMG99_01290 [Thermoplasmata archaeon]|nr:hypothetical protein [Thermoplasmata archaeon]